jgi:hypothetical protein
LNDLLAPAAAAGRPAAQRVTVEAEPTTAAPPGAFPARRIPLLTGES